MGFSKILVPTDFSEHARKALHLALEVLAADGHVTLANVAFPAMDAMPGIEPGAGTGPLFTQLAAKMSEEVENHLATWAQEEIPEGIDHDTVRLDGFPPESIADYARDNDYDLIVMGTHGHTGLKRVMLGSTTDRVLRLSEVPVLVCR